LQGAANRNFHLTATAKVRQRHAFSAALTIAARGGGRLEIAATTGEAWNFAKFKPADIHHCTRQSRPSLQRHTGCVALFGSVGTRGIGARARAHARGMARTRRRRFSLVTRQPTANFPLLHEMTAMRCRPIDDKTARDTRHYPKSVSRCRTANLVLQLERNGRIIISRFESASGTGVFLAFDYSTVLTDRQKLPLLRFDEFKGDGTGSAQSLVEKKDIRAIKPMTFFYKHNY